MEAEVRPTEQPSSTSTQRSNLPTSASDAIFRGVSTYPFSADPDFQTGLASILAPLGTGPPEAEAEQREETILQAQCFYLARKYNLPPIDHTAYKSWLQTQANSSEPPTPSPPLNQPSPPVPATPPPTNSATPPEPPYPTSFAHIVDLITRNQPIPGIEEIPDTVLGLTASAPTKTPRRKKPWEKDDEDSAEDGGDVVRMLQPIPRQEMPEDTDTETAAGADAEEAKGIKSGQGEEEVLTLGETAGA